MNSTYRRRKFFKVFRKELQFFQNAKIIVFDYFFDDKWQPKFKVFALTRAVFHIFQSKHFEPNQLGLRSTIQMYHELIKHLIHIAAA